MRLEKQRYPPTSCGMGFGRDSEAIPTPRHPHATRSYALHSSPCLVGRPYSGQRGRIRVQRLDRGPGVQLGCEAAAPAAPGVGPGGTRSLPRPGSRLTNQGAARARAAANQERRERRPEPAGGERAQSRDPAAALRPGRERLECSEAGLPGHPRPAPPALPRRPPGRRSGPCGRRHR